MGGRSGNAATKERVGLLQDGTARLSWVQDLPGAGCGPSAAAGKRPWTWWRPWPGEPRGKRWVDLPWLPHAPSLHPLVHPCAAQRDSSPSRVQPPHAPQVEPRPRREARISRRTTCGVTSHASVPASPHRIHQHPAALAACHVRLIPRLLPAGFSGIGDRHAFPQRSQT